VTPRPVTQLLTSNADAIAVARDALAARGLDDVPVELVQLMRTDLDGDGTDEVLIVAEHPDAVTTVGARAGWYNLVMLRVVEGNEARTHVLAEDVYTQDDPTYPNFARTRISAIADLNGDGRSEIVPDTFYFEGAGTQVFEYVDPVSAPAVVLDAGCGA
jgi:hypothetical protein